eukprot:365637-Chlamydomonas_euryale.AAC.3
MLEMQRLQLLQRPALMLEMPQQKGRPMCCTHVALPNMAVPMHGRDQRNAVDPPYPTMPLLVAQYDGVAMDVTSLTRHSYTAAACIVNGSKHGLQAHKVIREDSVQEAGQHLAWVSATWPAPGGSTHTACMHRSNTLTCTLFGERQSLASEYQGHHETPVAGSSAGPHCRTLPAMHSSGMRPHRTCYPATASISTTT